MLRVFCPYLPSPGDEMSYRSLSDLRGGDAAVFYLTALQYGQHLWGQGHSGRAILAITRALYADVPEPSSILREWPLPYRALRWIVANHPDENFPGNPRVSFQHQATRLRGDRQELRRARAWAVWALIREAKPSLVGDLAQGVKEPMVEEITTSLQKHGHLHEVEIWREAFSDRILKTRVKPARA